MENVTKSYVQDDHEGKRNEHQTVRGVEVPMHKKVMLLLKTDNASLANRVRNNVDWPSQDSAG